MRVSWLMTLVEPVRRRRRSRARIANEPAVDDVELSPAGALVLRADQTIELYDPNGTARARVVPDPGTRIAALIGRAGRTLAIIGDDHQAYVWTDDATFAVLGTGGLARFDATTGKLLAARCGWRFGKSSKPHPISAQVEPICAQLR